MVPSKSRWKSCCWHDRGGHTLSPGLTLRQRISAPVIDLYSVSLDAPGSQLDICWRMLDRGEKERANRFRFPQLKKRWLVSRAGLKDILAQYCSLTPENVRFEHEQYGKPLLADRTGEPNLHFNLSHSHNLALVGVTRVAPIGVDLEYLRPVSDWRNVAKRFFSPNEYRQFMRVPANQRERAFYCCWTRKEAVIKATGEGLSARLDSFDVSFAPGEPTEVIKSHLPGPAASRWQLTHLNVADGFVGAVALQSAQDIDIENYGPWRFGGA